MSKQKESFDALSMVIPDGTVFRTGCATKVDRDAEKAHEHTLAFDLSGMTVAELAELATRSTSPVVDWQRKFRADRTGTGKKAPKQEMPDGGEVVIIARLLTDKRRARKGASPMEKAKALMPKLSKKEREDAIAMLLEMREQE